MTGVHERAKTLAGWAGHVPTARLVVVVLLAAVLAFTHGWRSARAHALAREETLLAWMEREAARVRNAAPVRTPARGAPLQGSPLARISALAGQHDLVIARSNDETSGAVTLALDAARADQALLWLEQLEAGLGLRIEQVAISRAAAPGRANLQLRVRAP